MICHCGDAALPGTVGTAVERTLRLDTVAHDLAAAVLAYRSELVNGAFEAIKRMSVAGRDYLE